MTATRALKTSSDSCSVFCTFQMYRWIDRWVIDDGLIAGYHALHNARATAHMPCDAGSLTTHIYQIYLSTFQVLQPRSGS